MVFCCRYKYKFESGFFVLIPIFLALRSVPSFFFRVEVKGKETFLYVKPHFFRKMISFLKLHTLTQVAQFVDLTVIDHPSSVRRFTLVYSFLSFTWNFRVHLVFSISEIEMVPSLVDLYPSASWAEREAFDMFGVFFSNHPDLRRILTDYGFRGFPLRKDFPLTGYLEVRFDDEQKRVLYEPIELSQELRVFDFNSPWGPRKG